MANQLSESDHITLMERKHIVVDHGSVTTPDSFALFGDTHEKNNSLSVAVVVVVGGIVGLSPFFVMVHFSGGRGY